VARFTRQEARAVLLEAFDLLTDDELGGPDDCRCETCHWWDRDGQPQQAGQGWGVSVGTEVRACRNVGSECQGLRWWSAWHGCPQWARRVA
jgi:hypothetical protein